MVNAFTSYLEVEKMHVDSFFYKKENTQLTFANPLSFTSKHSLFVDVTLPYIENFDGATVGDPGILPTNWMNDSGDGTGDCAGTGGSTGAQECHDWQIHSGATPSIAPIGSNSDHTSGSGKYVYYEDSGNPNPQTNLLSPSFNLSGTTNPTVSFWFYAQSNNGIQNTLNFDLMSGDGSALLVPNIATASL